MEKSISISLDKIAWCPLCSDQLDTYKCFDEKGFIESYLYACNCCEKWFELKEVHKTK
jgi:hypothetical protein